MRKKATIIMPILLIVALAALAAWYIHHHTFALLSTHGIVATKERNLMLFAAALSLVVVVPVFALTFFIVWKYRASNLKPKKYEPDWDRSKLAESVWWGVPTLLILVLSVVTWNSSHTLDPYQPLASKQPAITVQVVALQWKWLFIYPQQHIASLNQLAMPVGVPVNFVVTADAPMNSFWIPQLGGQIYAMPGMTTALHLEGDTVGNYSGRSANISGDGFADMQFTASVMSADNFVQWTEHAQHSADELNNATYNALAVPHTDTAIRYFAAPRDLYGTILQKYMGPGNTHMHMEGAE